MSNGSKDFLIPPITSDTSASSRMLDQTKQAIGRAQSAGTKKELDEAHKAAEQFESLLLRQMFQEMWKGIPSNGLLGGGREEEYFRDMLNEGLADTIAEGQGIGVKSVILKDIQRAKQRYEEQK